MLLTNIAVKFRQLSYQRRLSLFPISHTRKLSYQICKQKFPLWVSFSWLIYFALHFDSIDFFKDAGEVVRVRLILDQYGEHAGFGFVEFASSNEANKVRVEFIYLVIWKLYKPFYFFIFWKYDCWLKLLSCRRCNKRTVNICTTAAFFLMWRIMNLQRTFHPSKLITILRILFCKTICLSLDAINAIFFSFFFIVN